tara:strand:- start:2514 stop:3287 length:774 start_codon:yes stop_codon:yes gene_type:complete
MLNHTKEELRNGNLTLGIGLVQSRVVEVAPLMKTAGFDWLFLDLEHGAMSTETVSQISAMAIKTSITPIVRIPIGGYTMVSRLLDNAAMGIVLPHVETAMDAQKLVDVARFPPLGSRGVGGPIVQFDYSNPNLFDLTNELNEQTLLVAMVETPSAIASIDEIASVEGIDVIMIGTNDLALASGCPQDFGNPIIVSAYEKVAEACKKHNKFLGSGGVKDADIAKKYIKMGAKFFLAGQDIGFLMSASLDRVNALRGIK